MRSKYLDAIAWLIALAWISRADGPPVPDAANLARAKDLDARAEKLNGAAKYAEAEPLARESLKIREESLDPGHPDVARSLNNLADALAGQGQYGAARPLYERALSIREKALGPEHVDFAESLNNLAVLLSDQGEHELAVGLHERALAIREKALGPKHPAVAESLNNLACARSSLGQYDLAKPLHERALAIWEGALGPEHPQVARSLINLATVHEMQGAYDLAQPLLERALAILEKALGPEHPDVARALSNVAGLLLVLGQYDEARPLYERALAIEEKVLGPKHPLVAVTLINLGEMDRIQGFYDAGRPLLERAVAIQEAALGADHPDLAQGLNFLGQLLHSEGKYDAARPYYERALAIRERALGPRHPDVALNLSNIAGLLDAQGQYDAARPLYERAIAILEGTLGPEHPSVALLLNNLGGTLWEQGQYDAARSLLERALAIHEKALGPDHPMVATSCSNLGAALVAQGQYAAARPLYERAIRIQEKRLGPDHPNTAASLSNLASLLRVDGQYDAARSLYERVLRIQEKALGRDHREVASTLHNLALPLVDMHEYEEARRLNERALAISEKALGPDHPEVALILDALAVVLDLQDQDDAARPLHQRAIKIMEASLRRGFAGLQAGERLRSMLDARGYLDNWLAAAARTGRSGYDEAVRIRGLVTRTEAAERALLRAGGKAAEARREELMALDRQLGGLSTQCPLETGKREAWRKQCAEIAGKREELLLALARDFKPLREAQERFDLTVRDVQARLREGEILLDFLRTNWGYAAFVVQAKGDVVRVDLEEPAEVDAAAAAFVAAVAAGEAEEVPGARLASLVLAPVRAKLPEGTRRIYVRPDAALAAVPFAALPGRKPGTFLVDEFEIVHVEMAQDLVPLATPPKPGEGALVVGGVDYGKAEALPSPAPPLLVAVDRAPADGFKWPTLPATAREAELLRKRDGTVVLSGATATEARFRELSKGKAILHLATHGYVKVDRLARTLEMQERARKFDATMERQMAVGTDPMLLAGLVLAGANTGDGGQGDDGLLTAAEASWLNLDGVKLAVLSACETGRGTPAAGEGTLGLVRGFRLAGAERVVASLWRVDDEATAMLMARFYEGYLGRGLSAAAALREAAIAVRDHATPDGKRPFAAPRYWAAFVAYGR